MNKPIPNGGPAFPDTNCESGMTLRDWFAGQALCGNLAKGFFTSDAVMFAYEAADMMLAARKIKAGEEG